MTHHADIAAFSDRFLAALERASPDEVRAFYTPDARLWHNFDGVAQTVDENMKVLAWMVRKFPDRRYRLVRREILTDGWVQQHVLEGRLPNGTDVAMHACCMVTMRDGRISRIEEYLDPAQAAAIRGA